MRARNLQALTDAVRRRHPGVVVYGKGDEAHAQRTSDHNEDDTPGVKAGQSDADSTPEHRAIDIMLGAAFTRAQAYALIADLLADPTARARLRYIIFDGWEWHRNNGWAKTEFTGDDKHRDHIHASGQAAADENAAAWDTVDGGDMGLTTEEAAEIIGGKLTKRNALHFRLRSIQDSEDELLKETYPDWEIPAPGLKQLDARVADLEQAPPGAVDIEALAALVRRVVREELDNTKLGRVPLVLP